MDKQLIEEARKERDLFCAVMNSQEWNTELRTACDSLLIMYDQLLDESTPAEDWVKVEDGLPETNCDVLVVKKNGKVFQMSYHQPFDSGKKIFQWWAFGKWIDQHSQVTHWRNLPSPPKK